MRQRVFCSLIAVSLICVGCSERGDSPGEGDGSRSPIEEAYAVIDELYDNEASDEEKLAATVEFLEAYPASDHTVGLVGDVVYFRGDQAGDMMGAVEFAERIRSKVSDPVIAAEFDRRLISWYGEAGQKEKMLSIADRLEGEGTIRFGDYVNVIDQAIEMEDWELVRDYCAKARPKANAATWRAEWPDEEATDERAEAAGLNRQGMVLVKDSWALANLGEVDEAIAGFARADEIVNRSYLGTPDENLNFFWGKTLLMQGDAEGAMEKFAVDALIAGDEDSLAELKLAYTVARGSEMGYEEWACKNRHRVAKTVDDFELPEPGGARHRFADLRGEVTLLNFWSPT